MANLLVFGGAIGGGIALREWMIHHNKHHNGGNNNGNLDASLVNAKADGTVEIWAGPNGTQSYNLKHSHIEIEQTYDMMGNTNANDPRSRVMYIVDDNDHTKAKLNPGVRFTADPGAHVVVNHVAATVAQNGQFIPDSDDYNRGHKHGPNYPTTPTYQQESYKEPGYSQSQQDHSQHPAQTQSVQTQQSTTSYGQREDIGITADALNRGDVKTRFGGSRLHFKLGNDGLYRAHAHQLGDIPPELEQKLLPQDAFFFDGKDVILKHGLTKEEISGYQGRAAAIGAAVSGKADKAAQLYQDLHMDEKAVVQTQQPQTQPDTQKPVGRLYSTADDINAALGGKGPHFRTTEDGFVVADAGRLGELNGKLIDNTLMAYSDGHLKFDPKSNLLYLEKGSSLSQENIDNLRDEPFLMDAIKNGRNSVLNQQQGQSQAQPQTDSTQKPSAGKTYKPDTTSAIPHATATDKVALEQVMLHTLAAKDLISVDPVKNKFGEDGNAGRSLGSATHQAIADFQKNHSDTLTVTGRMDDNTFKQLVSDFQKAEGKHQSGGVLNIETLNAALAEQDKLKEKGLVNHEVVKWKVVAGDGDPNKSIQSDAPGILKKLSDSVDEMYQHSKTAVGGAFKHSDFVEGDLQKPGATPQNLGDNGKPQIQRT